MAEEIRESGKNSLQRIPVLKLPASKLDACLEIVATSKHGLRDEIVKEIIARVYPGFTPKRAFRALVAPTLTRLHFARSTPPYFRFAPNGRIWNQLDSQTRPSYVALVLFDFALVRLGLPEDYVPPNGNLRDAVREKGDKAVDRVRGLDALLRFYHPKLGQMPNGGPVSSTGSIEFKNSTDELSKLIGSVVPSGKIVAVDEVRYAIMNRMLLKATMVSSFVIDEWLKSAIQKGILFASRAAYPAIDSLITKGYAINTVSLKPRT